MTMQFCPYCKCLILSNGKCRNTKCIMGNPNQASVEQIELIYNLMNELNIPTNGRDPNKLTKHKAGRLIKKLIAEKTLRELYGSEDL